MPFSYITLEASSIDGNEHSVQVYSDVTGGMITAYQSYKSADCPFAQSGFLEIAAKS